ncbi:MAG TPA: hypothetical protein VKP30_32930 [Polyangiaceae bacterium]|nr:hypothetical protein [Polyangiaceae bacterium]
MANLCLVMSRSGNPTIWGVLLTLLLPACASGPDPSAFKNKTFYEYGSGQQEGQVSRDAFEKPYPPLNIEEKFVGVQVLTGIVRFSRPNNWVIRRASIMPGQRFIEYVSPSQVMMTIYERIESPLDVWRDVMGRYEQELEQDGGKIIGKPVPFATFNAQGREYVIERGVVAPKAPFINRSREILLRSDHRIVLLQIVHQGDNPAHISDEIVPVLSSMQVL